MASSPALKPLAESPSSSSSSSPPCPDGDEREFDTLPSTIPETQKGKTIPAMDLTVKKFFTGRDEISESTLAQGFSWGPKQPHRPGQFSSRVRKKPSFRPALDQTSRSGDDHGQSDISSSPPLQEHVPQRHFKADALDLPELGLQGEHSSSSPRPQKPVFNSARPPSRSAHFRSEDLQSPLPPANPQAKPLPTTPREVFTSQDNSIPPAPDALEFHDHARTNKAKEPPFPLAHSHGLPKQDSPSTRSHGGNRRHDNLRLTTPHPKRPAHIQHRQSPASTCGDLEEPAYHSHRAFHHSSHNRSKPILAMTAVLGDGSTLDRDFRHRSQSRASNISRKRAGVHKPRHPDPERKKVAMHQVAQYWNECMGIAEEEKAQANFEIDRLRDQVRQHESKLAEARSKLEESAGQILETEERCKELEERDSRAKGENERLGCEVGELRGQLSESQQRATALRDKSRTIRSKLNEAIAEQQQLFLRSKSFCEEARKELQEERSKHAAYSGSIDAALENSRQKREAMKKCMEEFRGETERELQRKDQAIAEMKHKLVDHEAKLLEEKETSDMLRLEVAVQKGVEKSAQATETKIDSLLELVATKEDERREQAEVTARLNEKLDIISEHLKSTTENFTHEDQLQTLMSGVEQRVVSRVLPVILTVLSRQDEAGEIVSGLASAFEREARNINNRLDQQHRSAQHAQAVNRDAVNHIVDVFKVFEESLREANETWQKTEQRLDSWWHNDAHGRQEAAEAGRVELTRQLMERNDTINELQRQIQLTAEDYASRIEAIKAGLLRDDETRKKCLDEAMSELHKKLDHALNQEGERSEQRLRESEAARNSLKNQLIEAKETLATRNAAVNPNEDALQRSLQEERNAVALLNERIRRFEEQSQATEALQERWRRDVKIIDKLRPQLKAIKEKIPQMDEFGARLDRIAQLNGFIQSTASYLSAEGEWIHQQLGSGDRSQRQTSTATEVGDLNVTEPTAPVEAQNQEDMGPRKVIVHSPCVDVRSPSPPLSVEQEQRRRRDGARPRSILKLSTSATVETTGTESEFFARPANHSQYNRPVIGAVSTAVPEANHEMIEQIRSGLIQESQPNGAWSLPTVADFERSSQEEASSSKRRHSSSDEMNGGNRKRSKNGLPVPSDSLPKPTTRPERMRLEGVELESSQERAVTRAYSRKLST